MSAAAELRPDGAGRLVEVDLGYEPRAWQLEVDRDRARFSVVVVHRRGGKTVLGLRLLVHEALACRRQDPRYAYIAPLLKQAKAIAWTVLRRVCQPIPGCHWNESELSVELPNGAVLRLYGADNPDAFRGQYFDGAVLDELAQMRPQTWGEVILPALTDRHGWCLFIGTPKGLNLFSKLYFEAIERVAAGDRNWYAVRKTVYETGALAEDEIALARATMTDAQFAQEFLCDFTAAAENVLIPLQLAMEARRRAYAREEFEFAARVIGVDVARYGHDRTVVFPRQGLVAFKPRVLTGLDTQDVADHVMQMARKFRANAVFVDAGAMGPGVIDRLRRLGMAVTEVNFGGRPISSPRYENRRVEMWATMAAWLKAGGAIPDSEDLVADLCAPTYSYANAAGRMDLESKDELRARGMRSPDIADALALTFAVPDVAAGPLEALPPAEGRRGRPVGESDVFLLGENERPRRRSPFRRRD